MKTIDILLSKEFKTAVKKEFGNITGKIVLILNEGGIRDCSIEIKVK